MESIVDYPEKQFPGVDDCYTIGDFTNWQSRKNKCDLIIEWMLERDLTIRECEKETGIPRSTIHRYIHVYIQYYDDEAYHRLERLLRYNKQHKFCNKKQRGVEQS